MGDPVVWLLLFVFKAVVEILDHLMLASIRFAIVFNPNWVLPKRPIESAQIGMLYDSLIVDFRSHLAFIAPDGIPIQFFTSDLMDFARHPMPDTCCASAIDFHSCCS